QFFFSSRRRNTRFSRDWSSDVCSSDLVIVLGLIVARLMYDLGMSISLDTWTGEQLTLLANGLNLVMLALLIGWIAWCRRPVESRSEERRVGKEWRYRCCPEE